MTAIAPPERRLATACRATPDVIRRRAGLSWRIVPLLLLFALAACNRQGSAKVKVDPPSKVAVKLGSRSFNLEVVATETSRQVGLMYRKSLAADAGMVFVFGDEKVREFWMRNTSIPLDIVYLNRDRKIVAIKQMAPFDEGTTSSEAAAKYAIELNKGSAAEVGLKVGDQIDLPPRVADPPDLE